MQDLSAVAVAILARADNDDIQMSEAEWIAARLLPGRVVEHGDAVARAIGVLVGSGYVAFGSFIPAPGDRPLDPWKWVESPMLAPQIEDWIRAQWLLPANRWRGHDIRPGAIGWIRITQTGRDLVASEALEDPLNVQDLSHQGRD